MRPRTLAIVLIVEAAAALVFAVVLLDLALHQKFETIAGVNLRGFRGPARHLVHQPEERRLLFVGDATVFGYGVAYDEAYPFYLGRRLWVESGRTTDAYSVSNINAGAIGDRAVAYAATIRDFARYHPDIVVIDAGYDALCDDCAATGGGWRRRSSIYRATGYYPILPQYLDEKGVLLERAGGLRHTVGVMLRGAGRAAYAIDRAPDEPATFVEDGSCGERWASYCGAIEAAVAEGRRTARDVVVVTPPIASDAHRAQQRLLASALARRFGGDAHVRYVDAGESIALDASTSFDGRLRNARGNSLLAEALVPRLLPLILNP